MQKLIDTLVLIETLWNVKSDMAELMAGEEAVLIETLWNVKRHPPSQDHGEMSINRNIVECKGFSNLSISLSSVCINRNIVECKEKV